MFDGGIGSQPNKLMEALQFIDGVMAECEEEKERREAEKKRLQDKYGGKR
jgi:hypothetical protein